MSMKGPDAGLRPLMADRLKPHGLWFQAVETGSTTAGLPDSHVLGPTGTLWVESKRTLSGTGRLKFEPHQISWWRRHAPWIRGFVAVRLVDGGVSDGLAIFLGSQVDELADGGAYAPTPVYLHRGPSRAWRWDEVAQVLTGPQSV